MLQNTNPELPAPLKLGHFTDLQPPPMMAMVEITNRCNMACPVCFTNGGHGAGDVLFDEVRIRIANLLDAAGPIPIQISGGEPTLHPDLPRIITHARDCGFRNIELVTNGIRISSEPGYLEELVSHGLTAVYLQFDGLRKETLTRIRGQDMRRVREDSIRSIRRAKICCTLAVAVTRGVNDVELGDIVRFGINNIDTVRAINFQSAARFSGRFEIDGKDVGYNLPELIQRIEEQCGLPDGSFRTDLLGHPRCNAMALVYNIDNQLKPLFKYLSTETLSRFLGSNRRQKILDLFMGKERFARKYWRDPNGWKLLLEATAIFGRKPTLKSILGTRHLLIFAKSFMEKESQDPSRIGQCNYAIAATDGVYSFCAYNNLHRFAGEQSPNSS